MDGAQSSSQCQPLNPPLPRPSGQQLAVPNHLPRYINWTATVAGRFGYVWMPHTLVYAKAGVAIAKRRFPKAVT